MLNHSASTSLYRPQNPQVRMEFQQEHQEKAVSTGQGFHCGGGASAEHGLA